jgi:hypothetical protein
MMLGLTMLTGFWMATVFALTVLGIVFLALRFNDIHTHFAYDDHPSEDVWKRGLDMFVSEAKNRNVED